MLTDWAKSLDLDATPYLIPPPPPPPQPVAADPTASEGQPEQTAEGGGDTQDPSGNPVNPPEELMP